MAGWSDDRFTGALRLDGLPPEDLEAGMSLMNAIGQLESCKINYGSALELSKWIEFQIRTVNRDDRSTLLSWSNIAFRDASMTLEAFRKALESVIGQSKGCQSIAHLVDEQRLEDARAAFMEAAPDANRARNAIAHPDTAIRSPEQFQRQAATGPFESQNVKMIGPTKFIGTINDGESMTVVKDGRTVQVRLDQKTLDALQRSIKLCRSAFDVAQAHLAKSVLRQILPPEHPAVRGEEKP